MGFWKRQENNSLPPSFRGLVGFVSLRKAFLPWPISTHLASLLTPMGMGSSADGPLGVSTWRPPAHFGTPLAKILPHREVGLWPQ